ncbi:MAG: MBL fold metallo-hydrolase [Thermoplasmata archaeon]
MSFSPLNRKDKVIRDHYPSGGVVKVTWLGHAAFLLEGKDRILVDPFLSGNPMASMKAEDVECDIVCVTHAHSCYGQHDRWTFKYTLSLERTARDVQGWSQA